MHAPFLVTGMGTCTANIRKLTYIENRIIKTNFTTLDLSMQIVRQTLNAKNCKYFLSYNVVRIRILTENKKEFEGTAGFSALNI